PDWPYDGLNILLFAEAAAAFEELTLTHQDDTLRMQPPDAWPNSFRQARFLEVSAARSDWAPDPQHPLPSFKPARRVPHGVTLIGRLFEEGKIGRVGLALEERLK